MNHSLHRIGAVLLGAVLLGAGVLPGSAAAASPGHVTGSLPPAAAGALSGLGAAPPGTAALGTSAGTQQVAQDPTSLLKAALDAQVTRAVGSNGWKIVRIVSELKTSTLEQSASRQAGTGYWQVTIANAGAEFTFVGNLDFTVTEEPVRGAGTGRFDLSSESHVSGTLTIPNQAEGPGLGVDSDQTSTHAGVSVKQQSTDVLTNHGGDSSFAKLTVKRSVDVETLAWDLQRITETTTSDRDAEHHQFTRTTLLRQFGHGEAEIWQRTDLDPTTPASAAMRIHAFQRVRHGQAQMDVKTFTYTLVGKTVDIAAPGTISVNADGSYDVGLDYTVDGAPLGDRQFGSAAASAASTNPAHLGRQILDTVLPPPVRIPQVDDSTCTAIAGAVAAALLGIAVAYAFAPFVLAAAGEAITLAAVSGEVFGTAGLVNIIAGLAAGIAANLLKEKYPQDAGLIDAISAIFGILLGAGTGIPGKSGGVGAVMGGNGGILGFVMSGLADAIGGAVCNADPYFAYPDVRSGLAPDDPAPGSLLRTTGGLIVPDDDLNVPGLAAAPPATAPGANFSDAATAFVAGAVPDGATKIGTWQFDPGKAYGPTPSHTEPAADGPHKHVFIHATTPLQLAAGDNLVQYVWIDPDHPVKELLLQFYTGDGDGEHRAYWGDDLLQTGGTAGSASLYPMGALPAAGGWVRLRVPASAIGLEGAAISGVLYGSWNGQAWWGPTTTSTRIQDSAPDAVAVDPPTAPAPTSMGSQISFQLAAAGSVSLTVTDAAGDTVRTLLDATNLSAGYHVVTWDATDDQGVAVQDSPYVAKLQVGATTTALTQSLTITPFVAAIRAPTEMSLLRGTTVPVIGAAYGGHFTTYTLEVGAGRNPTTWTTIADSPGSVVPGVIDTLHPSTELGAWSAGLDELRPYTDPGLSGLQTLRLTVTGDDGRTASDQQLVVVGRLAHSAEGGIISSPDGRATLTIPPLATSESLSLLALLPLADTQPGLDISSTLPTGLTAAGDAWEILPPDESFRSAAELTLPGTDPTNGQPNTQQILGILIGDGTPSGWRTLSNWPDAHTQPYTASISELGGGRAIVVPVYGLGFPADADAPAPPPTIPAADAAPDLSSPLSALSLDFQSTPSRVAAIDQAGTQLALVTGSEAGLPPGDTALQITRGATGTRMVRISDFPNGPNNLKTRPMLGFDYRLDPGYAPDILVRSNDHVFDIHTGDGGIGSTKYYTGVVATRLVDDGAWHHAQLDLLSLLRNADPGEDDYRIDEILLGQVSQFAYGQVVPADSGDIGSSYVIDNFSVFTPTASRDLEINPGTVSLAHPTGFSWVIDRKRSTQAPTQASQVTSGTEGALLLTLPADPADGLWYVHVRERDGSSWSATATYPVVVDRTPPATSDAFPADGGSGGPTSMNLGVTDGTGIDSSAITASVNADSGTFGHGIRYEPGLGLIQVEPNLFATPGAPIPTGAAVSVTVGGVTDYAGNHAPDVTWHFTADAPHLQGDDFHQLTVKGGWSAAISPDGTRVAFVSDRDGTPRIYVMDAADFSETAGSAKALIAAATDKEWDPAWSVDGSQIAFGSNANGTDQLWLAAADGSAAHAITGGSGGVASPSWATDSSGTAFIRDGNAWLTDPANGALRALTSSPDHPYTSLAWQPDGTSVALHFSLYEDRIELLDTLTGAVTQVTSGGHESDPAWIDTGHILYTGPQAPGAQDAIWQVDTDGTNGTFLGGSGVAGVADSQANAAPHGGAVVVTSTRGGGRDVWIRRALTIGNFDASPTEGAPPGEAAELAWTLPAAAAVSVVVLGADGKPTRTLLSGAAEERGPNSLTWDGRDDQGTDLAPGLYVAQLSAAIAGVADPLTRVTTVRVLDARDIGTLSAALEAFPGTSARSLLGKVRVYPAGSRLTPLAEDYAADTATFKLPAGKYDLVALVQNQPTATVANVSVTGGQTTQATIDLGYGELDVTALSAPDEPAGGDAYVRVRRSDDPTGTVVAFGFGGQTSFLLPPDIYDISVDFEGTAATAYSVTVGHADVAKRSIDLGSGLITVSVEAWQGKAAFANQLIVRAYRPGDHATAVGQALFANPGQIRLQPGTYDLAVEYNGSSEDHASAQIQQWVSGVTVTTGSSTPVDVNLGLGELELSLFQAANVPVVPNNVTLTLVPQDTPDLQHQIGTILFAQHGVLQVPPGSYRVIVHHDGSDIDRVGPLPSVYTVTEGQRVTAPIDLGLGHLSVALVDAAGNPAPLPGGLLEVSAQAAGDSQSIPLFNANPSNFYLRPGVPYTITGQIDPPSGNPTYVNLGTFTLTEGQEQTLSVRQEQFQPSP